MAAAQEADRKFRRESEERQLAMMNAMEDKRVAREQAELARQDRVRENEAAALEKMEAASTANSEAVTKALKEEDKDVVMDFYSSLASGQGQGKRPD